MIAEYVEVTKTFPHTDGSPTGNEFWVLLNDGAVEAVPFSALADVEVSVTLR